METPTSIESKYGNMFLIEHCDEGSKPKSWVIALNSGLQCRTGPRRLYVHLARHLAEDGYGVTRVDLPGVGDSDGPTPPTHFDLHDPTNVRDVVEYVKKTHQPTDIILLGLCAGARAAIKAAQLNAEVSGVIALSMPTYTASPGSARSPEEPKYRLSKSVAQHNVDRLKNVVRTKNFMKLSIWRKYLNPKRTLKEIRRLSLSIWFLKTKRSHAHNLGRFISTLVSYASEGHRMLFLFGARDKIICDEFYELNLGISEDNFIIIPDGTHTFSTYSSHRQVVLETSHWLKSNFPVK